MTGGSPCMCPERGCAESMLVYGLWHPCSDGIIGRLSMAKSKQQTAPGLLCFSRSNTVVWTITVSIDSGAFGDTKMRRLHALLLMLVLTSPLSAADPSPSFTKKPTAVKAGDSIRIDFAVD